MCVKSFYLTIILVLNLVHNSEEYKFRRYIEAIGYKYYKILMSLGACKEKVLFFDQKVWGKITLNRVLDISYKCENEFYKVSRVDITLVINNTSSYAFSEEGVGNSDFAATVYLPTNLNFAIYAVTIYTCCQDRGPAEKNGDANLQTYMPFLHGDRS